jgi:hypothetical protein
LTSRSPRLFCGGGAGVRVARARTAILAVAAGALVSPAVAAAGWETAKPVDNSGTGYGASSTSDALSVGSGGTATALFFQHAPDTLSGNLVGSPFAIRRGAGRGAGWSAPT